jgi:hypothetical protein
MCTATECQPNYSWQIYQYQYQYKRHWISLHNLGYRQHCQTTNKKKNTCACVLQVLEWMPEYYTNPRSLPQEMPEDLKNTISETFALSPNHVSVSLCRHQKISLQCGYCTWKCIMTLTSNIYTRQAVYINVTLWHICTTIVAVETHQSALCFNTLSHTWHDFWRGKKIIEYKKRVLIFSTNLSETFLTLRIQWDITINLHRSSCKVPVILVGF